MTHQLPVTAPLLAGLLALAACAAPPPQPGALPDAAPVLLLGEQHDADEHQALARASVERLAASGRLAAHYAPGKPLDLVDANRIDRYRQAHPEGVAWLVAGEIPAGASGIGLPLDAARYGHGLYSALRELDAGPSRRIAVVRPPQDDSWAAVHDRLARAAVGSGSDNS